MLDYVVIGQFCVVATRECREVCAKTLLWDGV